MPLKVSLESRLGRTKLKSCHIYTRRFNGRILKQNVTKICKPLVVYQLQYIALYQVGNSSI